jgi:high-affinity iron transporter
MGQAFFASYLIGLREGLEMVLVVSVLVAYLVTTGRRRQLLPVWAGVGAAVVVSLLFGWLLTYVSSAVLYGPQHELFDAITSVVAVGLVTWMIFWMRRTARRLSGELRGRLDGAIGMGVGAVVGIAFLAIAREGLETTLLFLASGQGAATAAPLIGIGAGLATSVILGVLLYAGAIRIDLTTFFTISGVLLIFVAAGIVEYGIHDFQEAGVLPGLNDLAFDISGVLDPTAWYGAVISGLFNITPQPSVLETISYVACLLPVLAVFLWPSRDRRPAPAPNVVADVPPVAVTASDDTCDAGAGVLPADTHTFTVTDTGSTVTGFHVFGGTDNLKAENDRALDRFVWVGGEDAGWLAGGSYLVTRRIRMHVETWDTSTLQDQERTIGRAKGSGAALGQRREFDPVDFATQVDGQPAVPETSHVFLAHPNNAGTAILRRGYSFVDGSDGLGRLDAGLFLIGYQRDPGTGFVQVQKNLRHDALNEYIQHTSSAVFACPPGVRGDGDWWGRTLFAG